MAGADQKDIERLIKSTGFFRAKAKNIKGLSQKIMIDFGGEVPDPLEELITLPGVGHSRFYASTIVVSANNNMFYF